jgi:hypothetical protein
MGIAISERWWIYNRQIKISLEQDHILKRVENLEKKNEKF